MRNPFNEIKQNLNDSEMLLTQYLNASDLNGIKLELDSRIEEQVLQVMLYGAYNAGKSTLVNALLGVEKAVVNDIPTTDRIDCYDWNGYKLLDTPGVNAPIEHERTTQEQIKRTGAMLFVIREGDQDSKDLYERLFDMVKLGKQIFIVLNHQLTNQEDKARAHHKILSILCQLAPDYGVSDDAIAKIAVFPMNVKTALNARLKDHGKLLDHSGFTVFIDAFTDWMRQQDTEDNHLEATKSMVKTLWYKPVVDMLEAKNDENKGGDLKAFRDDLNMLTVQKRAVSLDARNFISHEVTLLKSQISQTLQDCQDQAQLDSELQQIFIPLHSSVESWLADQLGEINKKLSVSVAHQLVNVANDDSNPLLDAALDQAKSLFNDQGNLKEALLLGRRLKIPGLKGRWEKTLGSWAGKAAIAVQVVTFLWETYSAHEAQEKENQQRRQQAIELYQAVDQICSTVIRDLSNSVQEITDSALELQITAIEIKIAEMTENLDMQKREYQQLLTFVNQLESVSF